MWATVNGPRQAALEHARDCACAFCDHVNRASTKIRHHADTLETLIADSIFALAQ
ncbi:MAG: hypothetical protein IPQ28_12175 [Sphingobacteriales bacterium]|nr:hypothetical protein [Sphingobacteriales bacterium]